jgi:hypothetical protein
VCVCVCVCVCVVAKVDLQLLILIVLLTGDNLRRDRSAVVADEQASRELSKLYCFVSVMRVSLAETAFIVRDNSKFSCLLLVVVVFQCIYHLSSVKSILQITKVCPRTQ